MTVNSDSPKNRAMQSSLLLMAALAVVPAAAQQVTVPPSADPGAVQQRQMEEERRRREAEQSQTPPGEALDTKALEAPAPKPVVGAVRFQLREVQFSPSEILSQAELEKVAAEFRGREVSMGDLQQLVGRINAAYRSRKVITAQAVLPPQDITQGIVKIRLVEGHVGQTAVQGNASTRGSFVEHRLGLAPGQLVDLDALEGALVRFNRTNNAQLRASLRPGKEFGTTDFDIAVLEPKRHDLRLMVDDLGNPMTGRTRATLAYLNRSLFGWRDELSISDSEAKGQHSRAIGYGLPVNRWGGRLDLSYNQDKTAIKNGILAPLNITGESRAWTLSARQPVYMSQRYQLDVLASGQKRDSTNWIDSEFLSNTVTRDRSLGLEFQAFLGANYGLASLTRTFGKATDVRPISMVIDRGTFRFEHDFGRGLSLGSTLTWQATSARSLPSSEQFFIGGEGSVRGYTQGALSGDTGRLLNLTFRHPLWSGYAGGQQVVTAGEVSYDYGIACPFRPPESTLPARVHLAGIGWALNAAIGKRINGRLVFNYGLSRVADDIKDRSVHFQVTASFL